MDFRDFEGRVKKLVFNKSTITIRQLQYALGKDFDDFVDLTDKDSQISRILTSPPFQPEIAENEDWMSSSVDIDRLLLFGLLYCKGTHQVKCLAFYDILQDALQDLISATDKEITFALIWLFEVSTHWVHSWAMEAAKADGTEGKIDSSKVNESFAELDSYKELLDEMHENFLDDAFGNASRMPRSEFLEVLEKNCKYLFTPVDLRKKVVEQLENN